MTVLARKTRTGGPVTGHLGVPLSRFTVGEQFSLHELLPFLTVLGKKVSLPGAIPGGISRGVKRVFLVFLHHFNLFLVPF